MKRPSVCCGEMLTAIDGSGEDFQEAGPGAIVAVHQPGWQGFVLGASFTHQEAPSSRRHLLPRAAPALSVLAGPGAGIMVPWTPPGACDTAKFELGVGGVMQELHRSKELYGMEGLLTFEGSESDECLSFVTPGAQAMLEREAMQHSRQDISVMDIDEQDLSTDR